MSHYRTQAFMNTNFHDIACLQNGNGRQQDAYAVLKDHEILSELGRFDPILVGTIPINMDTDNSDLDVICCYEDAGDFIRTVTENFQDEKGFGIRMLQDLHPAAVVASFWARRFEIEIFGQSMPTKEQFAYRHMIVEQALLQQYGEAFRQQIVALKQQGTKQNPPLRSHSA